MSEYIVTASVNGKKLSESEKKQLEQNFLKAIYQEIKEDKR